MAGVAMFGGGEQAMQVLQLLGDSSSSSYSAQRDGGDAREQSQSAEFAGEDAYETFSSTVL